MTQRVIEVVMQQQMDYVYQFRTESGQDVAVRPLCASDIDHLLTIFAQMSDDSRYLRFNLPLNNPDPTWLREQAAQLISIPPDTGRGWIAFAVDAAHSTPLPVAGIRYVQVEPGVAELSLAVSDQFQGQGIGTALLRFAGRQAEADGYQTLIGVVQNANSRLWHSLRQLGVPYARRRDGAYTTVEVPLARANQKHTSARPDDYVN